MRRWEAEGIATELLNLWTLWVMDSGSSWSFTAISVAVESCDRATINLNNKHSSLLAVVYYGWPLVDHICHNRFEPEPSRYETMVVVLTKKPSRSGQGW